MSRHRAVTIAVVEQGFSDCPKNQAELLRANEIEANY